MNLNRKMFWFKLDRKQFGKVSSDITMFENRQETIFYDYVFSFDIKADKNLSVVATLSNFILLKKADLSNS